MTISLRDRLRTALPTAIKARDKTAVAALRSALAALDNAEAVNPDDSTAKGQAIEQVAIGAGTTEVERRVLTEPEMTALIRQEVTERENAAADYESAGRGDRATQLRAEAEVLAAHLAQ
jgi:uncharacterized protein YqeY